MAVLIGNSDSGTAPTQPIPLGAPAGQLVADPYSPAQMAALAGYQVAGESYTPGGLVVLPANLQPGPTYTGPLVAASGAVDEAVARAPGIFGRAIGAAASDAGTAAHNAVAAVAKAGWSPLVIGGAVLVGALLLVEGAK